MATRVASSIAMTVALALSACESNNARGSVGDLYADDAGEGLGVDSDATWSEDGEVCGGTVVVTCASLGSSRFLSELAVAPLDSVVCAGQADDGGIVGVRVVKRPDGSTAEPEAWDDEAVVFFVDLAGTYELEGYRLDGVQPCVLKRAQVSARPSAPIHVQLVWHNPMDHDETDQCMSCGADVDLHLATTDGEWFSMDQDCHYRSQHPDWGAPGPMNDPSLDIDDINGAGPENINVMNPEDRTYRVGVHYFDDHGFDTAWVTARIYIEGDLVHEAVARPLTSGEFWEVANIDWPARAVHDVDVVSFTGAQD